MKKGLFLLALLIILQGTSSAQAAQYGENLSGDGASKKLYRGLVNLVTAPMEIPKSIKRVYYESNSIAATIHGPLDGIVMTGVRLVSGATDVATFYAPHPSHNGHYGGLYEPEWVSDKRSEVEDYGYLKESKAEKVAKAADRKAARHDARRLSAEEEAAEAAAKKAYWQETKRTRAEKMAQKRAEKAAKKSGKPVAKTMTTKEQSLYALDSGNVAAPVVEETASMEDAKKAAEKAAKAEAKRLEKEAKAAEKAAKKAAKEAAKEREAMEKAAKKEMKKHHHAPAKSASSHGNSLYLLDGSHSAPAPVMEAKPAPVKVMKTKVEADKAAEMKAQKKAAEKEAAKMAKEMKAKKKAAEKAAKAEAKRLEKEAKAAEKAAKKAAKEAAKKQKEMMSSNTTASSSADNSLYLM